MKTLLSSLLLLFSLAPLRAADEITVEAKLSYTNSTVGITKQEVSVSKLVSITGSAYSGNVFSVPTTAGGTAIPISNLANVRWLYVRNLDTTNFVEIMTATSGTKFAKLKAGEVLLIPLSANITAPAAIADTAAVKVQYLALEN